MTFEKEELEQLQQMEIGLLRIFVEYCEKHGLRYYLAYGTLLGAVRHGGMIPWDDDIDVMMPRPDYEQFLAGAQRELPAWVFVQNYKTDPEFAQYYAKLRHSNTTFIEKAAAHLHINHGVYIDIFPMDGAPKGDYRRVQDWARWCSYAIQARNGAPTDELNIFGKLTAVGLRCVTAFTTPQRIVAYMDARRRRVAYESSAMVYADSGDACFQKRWFGKGQTVRFAGLECNAPEDIDSVLRASYGDYMQLPPPEKRVTNHLTVTIDLERPYTAYRGQQGGQKA